MKFSYIFLALALAFSTAAGAQTKVYRTKCKNADCFTSGWTTSSEDYRLDTQCKNSDCSKYGWFSVAMDGSTYDVTCHSRGCFVDGWDSTQKIGGTVLNDVAICKRSNCLSYGWTVKTGYDLMGGNVSCNYYDCSRYGGTAYWRGRPSRTVCYDNACYTKGWDLFVY